ncbi:nucleotide exchange factor GrpE, partial [Nocardia sp. NPDC058497]|uniref:nucleotide exchange factor GrpE n=1 Tax=Nocardia sp. NPDC058497 TaxID=3346529 RepID=UPI003650D9FA
PRGGARGFVRTNSPGPRRGGVPFWRGVLALRPRPGATGPRPAGPLKAVADKLETALTKQGLVEFGAAGESFDPTLHEAVQHEGSGADPVIGVVMRKGYRFGERVLRHALVGVTDAEAVGASDSDADGDDQ